MDKNSKNTRVLELYESFLSGRVINKKEIAERYGVNEKSVQRDIGDIRSFLAEQGTRQGTRKKIVYDRKDKVYKMISDEIKPIAEGEVLAICKIIIESRAFSKPVMESILQKVLRLWDASKDGEQIKWYIANELFNYSEPAHPTPDFDLLWMAARAIKEQKVVYITYKRLKRKETVSRKIRPVGILFSEYYFYLMGIIDEPEKRKHFDKVDDPYPTIYRVDRIQTLDITEEKFSVPYSSRFEEGQYKNKVQFMYGGEIQHIEFEYYGISIEAVLDRLPVAKVTKSAQRVYTVKAEVFGTGILMWLLSQGSKVKVIRPDSLRNQWLDEVNAILEREKE